MQVYYMFILKETTIVDFKAFIINRTLLIKKSMINTN